MKVSAVILAKNEEKNIKRAIQSVDFCDEIVVIDDNSTDKTSQIARRLGATVIQKSINGDFAGQRNFAMKQAVNEWILFLDADEEISHDLQRSCLSTLRVRSVIGAYYIRRRDFFLGKELRFGETQKVRNKGIIRLVKKNSGEWMGNVHEVFYTAARTSLMDGYITHYPHPSVKDFLNDINTYSSLRAKELYNHGKKTSILEIILYPFAKFLLNYFLYLGFLDGAIGFMYAFIMSFHSFLVRAKLYQAYEQ